MNPLHQLLLLTIIQSISCDYNLGFDKFLLLFPRYTVLQLTIGMSVPVILPNRTIVISPGIQNNFDLPYNLTNFQVVTYARSNQGFDISRDTMYGYIIGILENVGLNGEECLLRSICEVSRTPFHIEDQESVLERIAHHILTGLTPAMLVPLPLPYPVNA
ncbi:uncharacterized protein [Onthophagus taurus]|uniref:uncharacterized protein isoform X2 n=1 Tax=Onthophagus taurus TaxID=166361 RepID=UPI0039BE75A6